MAHWGVVTPVRCEATNYGEKDYEKMAALLKPLNDKHVNWAPHSPTLLLGNAVALQFRSAGA